MILAELGEREHRDAANDRGGAGGQRPANFADRSRQCFAQVVFLLKFFSVSGDEEQAIIDAGAISENRDINSVGLGKSQQMVFGQEDQEIDGDLHREKDGGERNQGQERRAVNDQKQTDDQPDGPGLNAVGAFLLGAAHVAANNGASRHGDLQSFGNLVFSMQAFDQALDRVDGGPGASFQKFHR